MKREEWIGFIKYNKCRIIAIVVAILIEVFICNYGFFRTVFVGNNNTKARFKVIDENQIKVYDINFRVTNITLKLNNQLTDKCTYLLSFKNDDSSDTFIVGAKEILTSQKQYINFDTTSNCTQIIIKYITQSEMNVGSIILNQPCFNFSILRWLCLYFGVHLIISLITNKAYNLRYYDDLKFHKIFFIVNLICFSFIIVSYTLIQFNNGESIIIDKNDIDHEDSILMQTEAFVNGQIKLMETPSEELVAMNNPYDNVARECIDYLYDVAYYNGNYYNYFGLAPIITLILPFRLITGFYVPTYVFNLVFLVVEFFVLYLVYDWFIKKFISKNISLFEYYLGYYAILFASNSLTLLRGEKYDIVVSAGLLFILLSIYLALTAFDSTKFRNVKLVFLGITSALIVLSKPNFIVYYIVILAILIYRMKEVDKKEIIKGCIAILIPLGLFGILQMIYNYIRFNNILEFGAKYQLTSFNMNILMKPTFGKTILGILEYLFRTISINPLVFPFVFANKEAGLLSINEMCYENKLVGLISIPIMYGFIFIKDILKDKNKEFNIIVIAVIVTSIISILISTWFGGVCEVYSLDSKMLLSLVVVMIMMIMVDKEDEMKERMVRRIFTILCICTIAIMVPIGINSECRFLENTASDLTAYLTNSFEFWT